MSPELRRALSPVERWYWIADQVSPLNVVARVHLRGHIAAGLLERAAAALVAEYPLLRVSITSDADGTNAVFRGVVGRCAGPQGERRRSRMGASGGPRELGTSLDWRTGPLVRIVDVVVDSSEESHDLVLTVSHIVADGTTALIVAAPAGRTRRPAAARHLATTQRSRPPVGAPEDLLPAGHRGPRGIAAIAATGVGDRAVTAVEGHDG